MSDPIPPVGVTPVGDDQPWKREQMRFNDDVNAQLAAALSRIATLEGRVN